MTLSRFSRPSYLLAFLGLAVACGGTSDAQLGGSNASTGATGGASSTGAGGQVTGNSGGGNTTGGNTTGGNTGGANNGTAGTDGNGGGNGNAGNGNAGNNGNGGSNGSAGTNAGGSGGANGTGGAPTADSGAAGSSGPDASAGGSGGSGNVDAAVPTQTVACPFPAATTNEIAPVPPIIKVPLCVIPQKCCYADVGSGGTCADHATACGVGIDTFQCDGPEDCTDGSVCCGYTPGALSTQAIAPIPIAPTTNTVCTTAQKCTSLTGRNVCHSVSDCGPGGLCAAGGGLPSPYKVCGPGIIILPPPVN